MERLAFQFVGDVRSTERYINGVPSDLDSSCDGVPALPLPEQRKLAERVSIQQSRKSLL